MSGAPPDGTRILTIWSDIACPWATVAVERLHETRARLGLVGSVSFEHRSFPLELINGRPTPRAALDSEIPVIADLFPASGMRVWSADPSAYPVTSLPALEAVHAAKAQGLAASEQVDLALRRAFFAEHRCISILPVILDVAATCDTVDVAALEEALHAGRSRADVIADWREADASDGIEGSPHLFLADGAEHHNPGVDFHWEGRGPGRTLVIDRDEASIYDEIVKTAAAG